MGESNVNRRVAAFDVLRILAFLMVVVGHVLQDIAYRYGTMDWPMLKWISNLGVSYFVFLSGIALAYGSLSSGLKTFYRKRLAAILPGFWTAYLVAAFFLFVVYGRVVLRANPFYVLQTLTALDGYLWPQYMDNYYVLGEWYTGFMLLTYVVTPLVYKGVSRWCWATLGICLGLSFLTFLATPFLGAHCKLWNPHPGFNVTARLFQLAAGIAYCMYVWPNSRRRGIVAALSAVFVAACLVYSPTILWAVSPLGFAAQVAAGAAVLFAVGCIRIPARVVPVLEWLSSASFLAFLYHHLIATQLPLVPVTVKPELFACYRVAAVAAASFVLAAVSMPLVRTFRKTVF